jgi:hypothetical protein
MRHSRRSSNHADSTDVSTPVPGLWARARGVLLAQLRQGITPGKLALTVGVAVALALFPVFGATTALCLAAGTLLRLNHPLMQLVNYALSPAQLALLIPFWKAGVLLGAPPLTLSIGELQARFQAAPLDSLAEFGWIVLGGIGAWAAVAPLLVLLIYLLAWPLLRRFARRPPLPAPPQSS